MQWHDLYVKWLDSGDYTMLKYMQKIERYLEKRQRTPLEVDNLLRQISAMLDLPVGECSCTVVPRQDLDTLVTLMVPQAYQTTIKQGFPRNINNLSYVLPYLENHNNYQIYPQNSEVLPCHPCWILWCYIFDDNYHHELWAYRQLFTYFMKLGEYRNAGRTFIHATLIRKRKGDLPKLHPHVLRYIMSA